MAGLETWSRGWPRWRRRSGELAGRVRASEQDAAAARMLAGGADRDVAEIRGEIRDFRAATTSSFNAMREDLADLRAHTDAGFLEMRPAGCAAAGQARIVELLTTLIDAPGEGSRDAPPPRLEFGHPSAPKRCNFVILDRLT